MVDGFAPLLPNQRLTVRQAEQEDMRHLTAAVNGSGGLSFYKAIFGQFNLPSMIDLGFLSLVVESVAEAEQWNESEDGSSASHAPQGRLQGFLCLNDQMSVVAEEYSFQAMIDLLKEQIPVTVNNALLFNFFMANEQQSNPAAFEMIKEAFSICANIDFFVWVCPFSYIIPAAFERLFTTIFIENEKANASKLRGYRILFCHRSNFLPRLAVRTARVEDNDDLIPIIRHTNPDVLLGQDRYFLADLIQQQDENNRFFVGLKHDHIVGMLSTSLDVNMSLIMKMFDIDLYPDLVIQSDAVPPPPPLLIVVLGDLRLVEFEALEEMLAEQHVLCVDFEKKKSISIGNGLAKLARETIEKSTNPSLVQAVVFWGFPRSEQEGVDSVAELAREADAVLELQNVSEDIDDDEEEEDDFLQRHLDAVESLRTAYLAVEKKEKDKNKEKKRATWSKVSYDQDSYHTNKRDNVKRLFSFIAQSLDERTQRTEEAKAINREKPPKANAFAVTALCLEEEFSSRSADLLKLAFEEQPQQAYCLYMVSNKRPPSRDTHCFNFVKTRSGISFDHTLYIIHRSYFLAQEHLRVQRVIDAHTHEVRSFLDSTSIHDHERSELENSWKHCIRENDVPLEENPISLAFSIYLGNDIVGLAVLTRQTLSVEDSNWYRQHYHLDESLNATRHRVRQQYQLLHWYIAAPFSTWSRVVLRHIMRVCGKTSLLFHCPRHSAPPKEVLEEFVFVRPKRLGDGPHIAFRERHPRALGEEKKGGDEEHEESRLPPLPLLGDDCPLYCISKNMLAFKKSLVSTRVVIMGGSSQSLYLLETICSVPNVYYPNIYFVCEIVPSPLRSAKSSSVGDDIIENHSFCGCLSVQDVDSPQESELAAMGYAFRVNVLSGRLTDIDRENKAVVISDEIVVEFDYLVISTWTQDYSSRTIPSLASVHPAKCADAGIFALGNPVADLLALIFIKKRTANKTDPVVICGNSIKALAAAEGLLRAGVDPSRLALVLNDSSDDMVGCSEPLLSNLIAQSPQVAGIKQIYWRSSVAEVSLSRNGFLQSVEIKDLSTHEESKLNDTVIPTRITCSALLLCGGTQYQSCEKDVFASINDCGLVFDGGLVVDLAFRTVDPAIYGVSDYSKFSRVYRDELPHARYNPREIGTYVAVQLIARHLHPFPETFQTMRGKLWRNTSLPMTESKFDNIVVKPRFSLPRAFSATLPADTHFFSSQLPRPAAESTTFLTDSSVISTAHFGAMPPRRVTALKIDHLGTVSEVTYAGLQAVEYRNLSVLPGKHESYLNSCIHAHRKNFVEDWIEFFRGEWAALLFSDDFQSFAKALKQSVLTDKGMVMLINRIFDKAESTMDMMDVDDYRRDLIGAHGELMVENTKKLIESQTADYLREQRSFYPKYYAKNDK